MVQAYLKRDEESNSCILLDEEGLCMVHKHHGHQYLSETCSVYPRTLLVFGSHLEESGHLSCPEVARLFLTSPILPVMQSSDVRPSYQPNHQIHDKK